MSSGLAFRASRSVASGRLVQSDTCSRIRRCEEQHNTLPKQKVLGSIAVPAPHRKYTNHHRTRHVARGPNSRANLAPTNKPMREGLRHARPTHREIFCAMIAAIPLAQKKNISFRMTRVLEMWRCVTSRVAGAGTDRHRELLAFVSHRGHPRDQHFLLPVSSFPALQLLLQQRNVFGRGVKTRKYTCVDSPQTQKLRLPMLCGLTKWPPEENKRSPKKQSTTKRHRGARSFVASRCLHCPAANNESFADP